MNNLDIYNEVREVPDEAKRKINGGRLNGKTDINPMWRIKKMTELFGPCGIGWYYKVINKWTEKSGDEIAAFVDIEMFIKKDEDWSMPIHGTGGSMFVAKERSGLFVSDECYKMATTDAISVACKQLGIGADVYFDADKTKYSKNKEDIPDIDIEKNSLLEELGAELSRTGYGWGAVIKKYKVDSTDSLTKLQIKDCITKMKKLPDKVA